MPTSLDESNPVQNKDSGERQAEILNSLPRSFRLAYLSFEYAETKTERTLAVREAHSLLCDKGIDEQFLEQLVQQNTAFSELEGYEPKRNLSTWAGYISNARTALGENRQRRGIPAESRSIVKGAEVEFQHGDD